MSDIDGMLANSMIVGAHPDDEMLWFNAIVGRVDEVVIAFDDFWAVPGLGEARRRAIGELPLPKVSCLGIAEAGSYGCADWLNPKPDPHGLALGLEETRRELTRTAKRTAGALLPGRLPCSPARVAEHYRGNARRLREALRPRLRADMNVFTHNPWGEYGHEDHVQLFRVLDGLRGEIGFRLWMSNYCTERALPLAMRYFRHDETPFVRLPTDVDLAERIADVYRRNGAWTWSEDWSWFPDECYMEAPRGTGSDAAAFRHLLPLNLFTIDSRRRQLSKPLAAGALAMSALAGAAFAEAL